MGALPKAMIQKHNFDPRCQPLRCALCVATSLVERSEELPYDMFVMSWEFNVSPRGLP